ncbi:hypothetical protein C3B44_07645 [Corynebacterium yudongzhengii]|uniref:HNH nuclease domain-containing protein n=1 Tax=Corynebacterium yudongzhengii TaxID=2080740 RepID=A0A2U1T6U0_9CORY|nr:HNH endonuclease signature motif containing protein [Corynebacterium yudongzhengii]AWB82244.1 hypothetical protein C3B44_07645 [Corynebacterium yudongzhengii]PWC01693.1 hypothetical protein DF222_06165 [Corynebacterium yudongzhengii]
MSHLDTYAELQFAGIDLLEEADRYSRGELTERGISSREASRLLKLSRTFFSKARHPRKQRDAVEAARRRRHSVDTLEVIRNTARGVHKGAEVGMWDLMVEFCDYEGSYDEIKRRTKQRVLEINLRVPDRVEKARSRRTLHISATITAWGTRRFSGEAPAEDLDGFLPLIDERTRALRKADNKLTFEQAHYDAVKSLLTDGEDGEKLAPVDKTYTPLVVVSAEDAFEIIEGRGDDVLLAATDGTQMTGRDLINERLSDYTYFGLVDPVNGPINLYQGERFANFKQRALARAETILCAWDGCLTPADRCEIHHIDAVSQGGGTDLRWLTPLCGHHNGRNDDDPHAPPKNGRVERINGKIHYRPPDGEPVRHREPVARMGMMDVIDRSPRSPSPDPEP